MSSIVQWSEHSLALPFLGIWMRIDLFQFCGHCWVFQMWWHIECSTSIAWAFRTLNSSAGILSPPLALLAVVPPKAHLTSHSRKSDSEWGTTPSWLSWSSRSFVYSSFVYSFCFFLIFSASIRSLPFLFFIVPSFVWNVPLIFPIFLKISVVLPFLLPPSISLHCSLKKVFLSLPTILWNSAFSWVYFSLSPLLFASILSTICKAFSDDHFASLRLFFFGMVLFAASYTILWTSFHSSSGTLFTRSNPLSLFITSTIYS